MNIAGSKYSKFVYDSEFGISTAKITNESMVTESKDVKIKKNDSCNQTYNELKYTASNVDQSELEKFKENLSKVLFNLKNISQPC